MSAQLIMTVEQIQEDREAWHNMRQTGLGGTDASVVAGCNKYRSLFYLWLEKTGQLTKEDATEDIRQRGFERMYWGRKIEDLIAERFTEETGKKVRRCGMLRSDKYPFMIADVDRLVVGENAILECKTTASWMEEEWEDDRLPDAYYIQVQHYMAVGGYDKCYLACLIGGNQFIIKEVPRNDEDIEKLVEAEKAFWERNVLAKELPTVAGTKECQQAIELKFPGATEHGEAAELDGSWDTLCKDLLELKEDKKHLEKIILEKENKLRLEMGNRLFGRSPKYNIWYKNIYVKKSFDSKQLAKDYPDIYKNYVTSASYRRLIIRESKARKEDD